MFIDLADVNLQDDLGLQLNITFSTNEREQELTWDQALTYSIFRALNDKSAQLIYISRRNVQLSFWDELVDSLSTLPDSHSVVISTERRRIRLNNGSEILLINGLKEAKDYELTDLLVWDKVAFDELTSIVDYFASSLFSGGRLVYFS